MPTARRFSLLAASSSAVDEPETVEGRASSHLARQMFRTLAEEGINIQMISTSEIKISVVIDEKYMELAVRTLHKSFGLDQPG